MIYDVPEASRTRRVVEQQAITKTWWGIHGVFPFGCEGRPGGVSRVLFPSVEGRPAGVLAAVVSLRGFHCTMQWVARTWTPTSRPLVGVHIPGHQPTVGGHPLHANNMLAAFPLTSSVQLTTTDLYSIAIHVLFNLSASVGFYPIVMALFIPMGIGIIVPSPSGLASWATSGIRASLFDKEEDLMRKDQMAAQGHSEGQSVNRPPRFDGEDYTY
ncbi:hypothetical protein Taro_004795 [Colocasia esculenta]|uniref:Uncharacterized protein n=1 Tax=Colocasia esculenta TaxID=4460 RepID=A0A843TN24_COLES|nr:hypothetical protein [Colocasia esculenta]